MSERVSNKQLAYMVQFINKKLNRPAEPSYKDDAGHWCANVGHIFIDHYNPGGNPYSWKLAEYSTETGGEHDWTVYRMTLKEFYAYLKGITQALEL